MKTLLKPSLLFLTLVLSLAFAATSRADNLVLNGDFGANATDYTTYPYYNGYGSNPDAPTDWAAGAGGVQDSSQSDVFGPSNLYIDGDSSNSVSSYAFLQNYYASVSQSFDVVAGENYDLTFVAGARSTDASGDQIIATVTDDSDSHGLVNQTEDLSYSDFTSYSIAFQADVTGAVTLTFTPDNSNDAGDYTADVSNVDVEATGSVPEPSTWAMLGTGAIALLGFMRLRRSA